MARVSIHAQPRQQGLVVLVAVLACFMAIAAVQYQGYLVDRDRELNERLQRASGIVEREGAQVLNALGGVAALLKSPSRDGLTGLTSDFHAFVDRTEMLSRHRQMSALAVAVRLRPGADRAQLAALIADPARDRYGYGPFTLRPETDAALKYPVVAVAPKRIADRLVGFDFFSEPTRRETAMRAIEVGRGQISARIDLQSGVPGIVLVAPIFRDPSEEKRGEPPSTLILSAYTTSSFLTNAFGALDEIGVNLELHDVSSPTQTEFGLDTVLSNNQLASTPFETWTEDDLLSAASDVVFQDVELGGRTWRVFAQTRPGAIKHSHLDRIMLIFLFGAPISALAGALVYSWSSRAAELSRRVDARTQELIESRTRLIQRDEEARELAAIAERLDEAIVVTDLAGRVLWCNSRFEQLSGYSEQEAHGRTPGSLLQGPDTDPATVARIQDALQRREPIRTEILNYSKDGAPYWIELSISMMTCDGGKPWRFVAVSHDITAKKRSQEELEATANALRQANVTVERQAKLDDLTGVPNRRALSAHLDRALQIAREDGHGVAVLHVDLDRFKQINDTLGHAAGDMVLRHVAATLKDVMGPSAFVARLGGDEFVIVSEFDGDIGVVERCADAIVEACAKPIEFDGRECRFGASVGVASTARGDISAQQLLINSDLALYRAKREGRNRRATFTRSFETEVIATKALADALMRALEQDQFHPAYQPQFDAASGALVGIEALARWRHPERGLLTPAMFLDVAEELCIVSDIDHRILEKSVQMCRDAAAAGIHVPGVSVNVSFRRLGDPQLIDRISALPEIDTPISFELLESIFFDEEDDALLWNIDRLRERGVGIEIDDFGSGRASIIGLTKIRPDRMKIDRQLVRPIETSPGGRKLIQSIVSIGHSLDIPVTAEGVETEAQAAILRDLGCDTLQGYHFARPMEREALFEFFAQHPSATGLKRRRAS